MLNRMAVWVIAIGFGLGAGAAVAADVAAGKAEADHACGACHKAHSPVDWKGDSAADIEARIKTVLAGTAKHPKKLQLTDEQIADVAAYWVSIAN
jgi:mono/diheme cytochrome c family protein